MLILHATRSKWFELTDQMTPTAIRAQFHIYEALMLPLPDSLLVFWCSISLLPVLTVEPILTKMCNDNPVCWAGVDSPHNWNQKHLFLVCNHLLPQQMRDQQVMIWVNIFAVWWLCWGVSEPWGCFLYSQAYMYAMQVWGFLPGTYFW